MTNSSTFGYEVKGKVDPQAGKDLDSASKSAKGLGGTLTDLSKIAGGFIIGQGLLKLPGLLSGIVGGASDLNESVSKAQTVFGDSFGAIDQYAKDAAKSMGMTRQQALEATGTFGNFLQAMGTAQKPAADMSKAMVTLAADLGSFNNANPEEVLLALRSGLSGEAEPLRKYGVALSETAVSAKALQMGLKPVGKEFTEQQKIAARYAIIMDQTKVAQGDFARTSDGLANGMKILKAEIGNLANEAGSALLPTITSIVALVTTQGIPAFRELAATYIPMLKEGFASAAEAAQPFIDAIVPFVEGLAENETVLKGLAAVLGGVLVSAFAALSVAAIGFVAGMVAAAVPIIALGVAMAGLVLGVRYVIQHWDELNAKFPQVGQAVAAVQAKFAELATYWNEQLGPAIERIGARVQEVVTNIIGFVSSQWPLLQEIFTKGITVIYDELKLGFDLIKDLFRVVIDIINGDWDKAWKDLKTLAVDAVNNALTLVKDAFELWRSIGTLLLEIAKYLVDQLAMGLEAMVDKLKDLGKRAGQAIWEGIKEGAGDLTQKAKDLLPDLPSLGLPSIHLPGRAYGGDVQAGRSYSIAEHGRGEIFTPSVSGSVSTGGGDGTRSLAVTLVNNGTIVGIDDLDTFIRTSVMRGVSEGHFRGSALNA